MTVLVLSLVAAACGGDEESPSEPGTSSEAPTVTGGEFSMYVNEPESLIPQVNAETGGSKR